MSGEKQEYAAGVVAEATPEEPGHSRFGEDEDQSDIGRDRWPSRTAFYLAAVGSAVGFGNVWRFPALAKDYGGGAFFIPYLMALFLIGLPVLILEIALGQYYQTSVVGVYGTLHRTMRGNGVAAVVCAFILVTYYCMLLAWVANAFFDSFGTADPWTKPDVTGADAIGYFTGTIIGMETLGDDLRPTRVVGNNVGYAFFVWVTVYLCLGFGMKWTGRVAYITMGLPILFLLIFLFRSIALEGSGDGIREYIGRWDVDVLSERADVWSTAVSQIFFSLSVTFGTMPAYGAACPRGEPAFVNSVVVGLSNSMFSFLAGFAVFAALGHLAFLQGVDVNTLDYSGFSLVFGTWPVVFGTLPGGEHWVRLLFLDLYLLGLDSAFSILEAPLAVAMDYKPFRNVPKRIMSGIFCFIGFLFSIIYASDAGLIFLDTIDFYINFVFLLLGLFETIGAGWLFGIETQIALLGAGPVFSYMFTNFGSVIVACGLWFGLDNDNEVWGGFLALFLCYFFGMGVTLYLLAQKKAEDPERWTWKAMLYELAFANVFELTRELSKVVGHIPLAWGFAIKQLIPHILLVLFINLAQSDNGSGESRFGHYGEYESWPFQVLGILCVGFAALVILVGFVVPKAFEPFDVTLEGPINKIERTSTIAMETQDEGITKAAEKEEAPSDDEKELVA